MTVGKYIALLILTGVSISYAQTFIETPALETFLQKTDIASYEFEQADLIQIVAAMQKVATCDLEDELYEAYSNNSKAFYLSGASSMGLASVKLGTSIAIKQNPWGKPGMGRTTVSVNKFTGYTWLPTAAIALYFHIRSLRSQEHIDLAAHTDVFDDLDAIEKMTLAKQTVIAQAWSNALDKKYDPWAGKSHGNQEEKQAKLHTVLTTMIKASLHNETKYLLQHYSDFLKKYPQCQ